MRKILVAGGPSVLRGLLAFALDPAYQLEVVHSSVAAVDLSASLRPDIVMLEPSIAEEADGYQVLQAIKAKSELVHTRVFMVTSLAQKIDYSRAMKLGADGYLIKPVGRLQMLAYL